MIDWIQQNYEAILAWALVVSTIGAGLAACVIPFLPGHIIMLAGMILGQVLIPEIHLSWYSWVILCFICLMGAVGDNLLAAWGAKRFGSTRAGIWGAVIGLIIGIFAIPGWGIIVGPFTGALAAEIFIERNNLRQSLKSGVGAFLGSISGVLLKIISGIAMVLYFIACAIIH